MGYVEVVVAYEHGELIQDGFIESSCHSGHALGATAGTDQCVVTVHLEDGIQTVESGQSQIPVVLAEETCQ